MKAGLLEPNIKFRSERNHVLPEMSSEEIVRSVNIILFYGIHWHVTITFVLITILFFFENQCLELVDLNIFCFLYLTDMN